MGYSSYSDITRVFRQCCSGSTGLMRNTGPEGQSADVLSRVTRLFDTIRLEDAHAEKQTRTSSPIIMSPAT